MNTFSPEWLNLRESADARARNSEIAQAVAGWFALREHVSVVDLGSGTGANLRAASSLLPQKQTWTLVDHNPQFTAVAREALTRWADSAQSDREVLHLVKGQAGIAVHFKTADLAHNLSDALGEKPDLVTASAFSIWSPRILFAPWPKSSRPAVLCFTARSPTTVFNAGARTGPPIIK